VIKYAVSDSLIITKRQLLQLIRVPEVLIFSTIQPVMFVLLFRYVFGGSISTGIPGVDYVQLLMPGIFVQTVAFTLAGTAVGLAEDMQKGLIDRFRSLPISRSAVVFGRTLGDGALNIVVLAVMGLAGYAVGWRPSSGLFNVLLGFAFLLLFGFAMAWVGVLIGSSGCQCCSLYCGISPYLPFKCFCSNYWNAKSAAVLCGMEPSFNNGCWMQRAIWASEYLWRYR
jgi:ABC-2 type transport system permease protein